MNTIQELSLPVLEQVYKNSMKRDFPRNELRPLASLKKSWIRGEYTAYGFYEDVEMLGYATFIRLPSKNNRSNYLFDYLAIMPEHRDQGLGSCFLQLLATELTDADCILGEVEDPDKAAEAADRLERSRRLKFYVRNGYRVTDVTSLVFGVNYRLLEIPTVAEHSNEEVAAIYTAFYQNVLPDFIFRRNFQVQA